MTLKSLFFCFSYDSRIARLRAKYDRLKQEVVEVQDLLERAYNPQGIEDLPDYMVFIEYNERHLRAKLKSLCKRGDKCRREFLWLEYKRDDILAHI